MTAGARRIEAALREVEDTKAVVICAGAVGELGRWLRELWSERAVLVIADRTTWEVAGEAIAGSLRQEGMVVEPLVFQEGHLHADYREVVRVRAMLEGRRVIPLAVGSGTLNDIVKLASEEAGRRYAVYATAPSMDGYASYGASITTDGIKRTMWCRAPRLVVADPEVLGRAPPSMRASGYADLLAKLTAGADWMLADALAVEPIHAGAWRMTQDSLMRWTADPDAVARGSPDAVSELFEGLIFSGLGMQAARSSRPASGAEHIFSHLWEMEDRQRRGVRASHGFKVGIGMLASAGMYDFLRSWDGSIDSRKICSGWPDVEARVREARRMHVVERIADAASEAVAAKHPPVDVLRGRHERVLSDWPEIRGKLACQVPSAASIKERLRRVGAPTHPEEIGLNPDDYAASFGRAATLRERYTVLDFLVEVELMGVVLPATLKGRRR